MTPIAIDLAGLFPTAPRTLPIAPFSADFALLVEQAFATQPPPPEPIAPELAFPALPVVRHDLAGQDGNTDAEAAELAEDEEIETPIWLPATLMLPTPTAGPAVAPAPALASSPLFAARASQPIAPVMRVELALPAEAAVTTPGVAPEPLTTAKAAPAASTSGSEPVEIEIEPPAATRAPEPVTQPAPAPPPQSQPQLAAATLPGILFQSAGVELAPANDRGSESEAVAEPAPVGASQPGANQRVEAAGGASDSMLDMSRGDWMESMIERIDAMQAEGGERVAHLRLRPDALGAVEVRVRQEGETLHVSFAADNPAARQMLSDATPRLAELAAARGLTLSDAGVGQGFGRDQQAERPRSEETVTNRAPRRAAEITDTRSDERIA